ncbi:MAG: LON peptidase substrate-binding domain-containing protein [Rhodospirillales bacterium]|nr:LON peptidase substrate-binding domain-containing protein [Rhodospirillales bacterium]
MTPDGLPPTIPVFPLTGALLLPYGQLPLNIFEPRYVALTEDALGADRFMGMIQPQGTELETVGDDSPLFGIGCLGRITEFADPGDGRYEIVLTGVCRFKIARELDTYRGYRRVEADYNLFLDDLDPSDTAITNRSTLLAALKIYFERRNLDTDWDALDEVPDLVLVTTAAMGCPMKPEEKQLLLEAQTLAKRAEQLQTILEIAMHGIDITAARH